MSRAAVIQAVGKTPVLGNLLRAYARRFKEGSVVTIMSGLAAGSRWKRHHRYVNGYWTGQYELPMQMALRSALSHGQTFYDLGANAGFFSLVASKLVGDRGTVVSFDPDPDNAESILAQIDLNALSGVWRHDTRGIADRAGTATFERAGAGSPMGQIRGVREAAAEVESFDVRLVALDSLLDEYAAPDVIKMDIEGAETLAVRGGARVIAEIRPTWLIELHGDTCEVAVREAMEPHGYAFSTIDGDTIDITQTKLPKHFVARPI